jgi:hypothetical protein
LRQEVGAFFSEEAPVFEHLGDGFFSVTYRSGSSTVEVCFELPAFLGGMANAKRAYAAFTAGSATTELVDRL